MPFSRYVEIGRVALVNYGADAGKLVVITDVIDSNRALVDRPDAVRKALNFKRLALTDIKIDIPRAAKKSVLAKALAESQAFEKFAASAWGRKLARREAKAGLTDLERYKASVKRAARAKAIKAKLG